MENQIVLFKKQETEIESYIANLKKSPIEFLQDSLNIRNILQLDKNTRVPISFLRENLQKIELQAIFVKIVVNFASSFNCKKNLTEVQIKDIVNEIIENDAFGFFTIEEIAYCFNTMKTGGARSFVVFDYIDTFNVLQGLKDELFYVIDFIVHKRVSLIKKRSEFVKKMLTNKNTNNNE